MKKIAYWYLKNIDSSLLLYNTLKPLHWALRSLFYIFIISATYVSLSMFSNYFDNNNIYTAFVYIITVGVSLVITLEFIYKEDVIKELKTKRRLAKYIKFKKLQWFRLRNIHWFFRFIIYILNYIVMLSIFQTLSFLSYLDIAATGHDLDVVQIQNSYQNLLSVLSIGFIVVILIIEYLISKKTQTKGV